MKKGATVAAVFTVEEFDALEVWEARDLADDPRTRATIAALDSARAEVAALFAHVCRLAGVNPRTAPQEIAATVKAFEERREAQVQKRIAAAVEAARSPHAIPCAYCNGTGDARKG